eukprot:8166507-Pyramimonas_sp.AAC.1
MMSSHVHFDGVACEKLSAGRLYISAYEYRMPAYRSSTIGTSPLLKFLVLQISIVVNDCNGSLKTATRKLQGMRSSLEWPGVAEARRQIQQHKRSCAAGAPMINGCKGTHAPPSRSSPLHQIGHVL